MQILQQKIGNLEIIVNALMAILEDKEKISNEEINEKAQEIVQQIKEQHDHDHDHGDQEGSEEQFPL